METAQPTPRDTKSSDPPRLSVIVPAYNEEDCLVATVDSIHGTLKKLQIDGEIIIVDDGSTDQTGELADALPERFPDVVVLHQHNQGVGGASRTGIRNSKGAFLIIWPADMFCAPDDLRPYVNQMGKADVIVGCRRRRVGYNPLMRFNAWLYPRLVAALFGLRLRDVNWICLHRGDMARQVQITQDGIPMLTEILVRLRDLGATFLEIEVDMNKRVFGVPTASRFTVMWRTLTGMLLFWQAWRCEKRNSSKRQSRNK